MTKPNRRNEMDEILKEVQENHKKLESCQLHDFSVDLKPGEAWGKKYQCTKCGGTVDSITKSWYEKGLAHARESLKEDIELADMYRGLCK